MFGTKVLFWWGSDLLVFGQASPPHVIGVPVPINILGIVDERSFSAKFQLCVLSHRVQKIVDGSILDSLLGPGGSPNHQPSLLGWCFDTGEPCSEIPPLSITAKIIHQDSTSAI